MQTERKPYNLSAQELVVRNRWRKVLRKVVRSETVPTEESGIEKFVEHRRLTGMGGIVFANHFDKLDPIAVAEQLCAAHPELAGAELVIPIADHQKMDSIRLRTIARYMTTSLMPIVSENSRKKYKKKIQGSILAKIGPVYSPPAVKRYLESQIPPLNEGRKEFIRVTTESLPTGAPVYLPTKPERSHELCIPEKGERNLGSLLVALKKNKVDIDNIGILYVGVSLKDPNSTTPVEYRKRRGLNLLRSHRIRFGEFMTVGEILALPEVNGDLKMIDRWSISHGVAPLVDPEYVSDNMQREISIEPNASLAIPSRTS